ncbi:Bug family tripartite tricarboxylate transporter substrate binding protein [Roseococcus sp.]|uniref:Bug family tripartite tricarboxylate transporter substrate binding protein n=1 Tax=Roseococcus sp. TaxID=2109646 RepID=UPI003BA8E2BA
MNNLPRRGLLSAAALLPMAAAAQPAAWPDRPVRLVVPFPPGTTTDTLGRLLGNFLSPRLGQPVVVENRSGAGGGVGAASVARSAPDGLTLLLGTIGTQAVNPNLVRDIGYDPLRDFAPISTYVQTPVVLGVRPALGVSTVSELVALGKQRNLTFASAGIGTTGHLSQALFSLRGDVATTHVPYRDGGRAVTDLISGQVDAMFYHPLGFLPHIQAGTIRPLAATGHARSPVLPQVPTMAQAGLADFVVEGWWAIYAAAGTPAPVVARLNTLVNAALVDPDTAEALRRQGVQTMGGTSEALAELTRSEVTNWREVIRAAGITAD